MEQVALELDFERGAGFGETAVGRHSREWHWQDRDAQKIRGVL